MSGRGTQGGVAQAGGTQSGGTPTVGAGTTPSAKLTLSIRDVKFDTKLDHTAAAVLFRRLCIAAETLSCETGLQDDSAPPEAKRQAKFLIAANLPDDHTHLLDATPAPSAKELYDKLTARYAGTTYVRNAELLQRLIYMRPLHEKLAEFLTRAIQLRAEMASAKCCDEELMSAMFLSALCDTKKLHDWSVQQLQKDPPAQLPELVASVKTVHRNLLDETFFSSETSARTTSQGKPQSKCIYCQRTNHYVLSCWQLREDQMQYDQRQASRGRGRGGQPDRGGRQIGRDGRQAPRGVVHQVDAIHPVIRRPPLLLGYSIRRSQARRKNYCSKIALMITCLTTAHHSPTTVHTMITVTSRTLI
jgi:hypothetical protein